MDEPLHHIQELQRTVRFWRNTSLILAAILVSGVATGFSLFSVSHRRLLAEREHLLAVVVQERVMAATAEAARLKAERALQEAKERKD
jgi:hypothetical protein